MEQQYTKFKVEDGYIYGTDGTDVASVPNNSYADRPDPGDNRTSGHEPVTKALLKTALLSDGATSEQTGLSISVEAAVRSLIEHEVIKVEDQEKEKKKARALIEFLTFDESHSAYSVDDDGNINVITQLDEDSKRAEIDNVAALANLSHEIIQNKIKEAKEKQQLIEDAFDKSEIDEQVSNPQQALDNVVSDLQRFGKDNETLPKPKRVGPQGQELEAPDEVSPENRRDYVRKLKLAKEYEELLESSKDGYVSGGRTEEEYTKELRALIKQLEAKQDKLKNIEQGIRSDAEIVEIDLEGLNDFAITAEELVNDTLGISRDNTRDEFIDNIAEATSNDLPDREEVVTNDSRTTQDTGEMTHDEGYDQSTGDQESDQGSGLDEIKDNLDAVTGDPDENR